VALDNDHVLWNAFHNEYWPAHYLIDAQGRIRAHHFEGGEEEFEAEIRRLLAENGAKGLVAGGIATLSPASRRAQRRDNHPKPPAMPAPNAWPPPRPGPMYANLPARWRLTSGGWKGAGPSRARRCVCKGRGQHRLPLHGARHASGAGACRGPPVRFRVHRRPRPAPITAWMWMPQAMAWCARTGSTWLRLARGAATM
jgi:hypothetical protein